jgi:hypothetical protein
MSKGDIQTRRICVNADGPEVLKYDLYLGGEMAVAAQKVVTTKVAEADDAQKQSEATKQTLTRLGTGLRAAGELAFPGQGDDYADYYLKEPKAELAKFEQRAVEHQAAAVSARNNFEMLREKTQKCIVPVRSNVEIQFGQAFDALKASGENGAMLQLLNDIRSESTLWKISPKEDEPLDEALYRKKETEMLDKFGQDCNRNPKCLPFLKAMYQDVLRVNEGPFKQLLNRMEEETGLSFQSAPVKGFARALEKTAQQSGDFRKLHDLYRATILCVDLAGVRKALDFIAKAHKARNLQIMWLEEMQLIDEGADVSWNSGYRHISMELCMAGCPVVGELQINTVEMAKVKEQTSHLVYEYQRTLNTCTDSLQKQCAEFGAEVASSVGCGLAEELDLDFSSAFASGGDETFGFGDIESENCKLLVECLQSDTCCLKKLSLRGCVATAQAGTTFEQLLKRLFTPQAPPVVANKITTVDISLNPGLTAPGLRLLTERLHALQVLKCSASRINSEVFEALTSTLAAACPCLQVLDVSENEIDGEYLSVCPVAAVAAVQALAPQSTRVPDFDFQSCPV